MSVTVDNPSMETISVEDGADIVLHNDVSLLATQRCDRCGSQAHVHALLANGDDLLFCAHHGSESIAKLTMVALTIHDYRPFLVVKETTRVPLNS
jgi:hypothetical protein